MKDKDYTKKLSIKAALEDIDKLLLSNDIDTCAELIKKLCISEEMDFIETIFQFLFRKLHDDTDSNVHANVALLLAKIAERGEAKKIVEAGGISFLLKLLSSGKYSKVEKNAAFALAQIAENGEEKEIVRSLYEIKSKGWVDTWSNPDFGSKIFETLGYYDDTTIITKKASSLLSDPAFHKEAIKILANIAIVFSSSLVDANLRLDISELILDPNPEVVEDTKKILDKLTYKSVEAAKIVEGSISSIVKLLSSNDRKVQANAAFALAKITEIIGKPYRTTVNGVPKIIGGDVKSIVEAGAVERFIRLFPDDIKMEDVKKDEILENIFTALFNIVKFGGADAVVELYSDSDIQVRNKVSMLLDMMATQDIIQFAIVMSLVKNPEIREKALNLLDKHTGFKELLKQPIDKTVMISDDVGNIIIEQLPFIGRKLSDSEPAIRANAAMLLGFVACIPIYNADGDEFRGYETRKIFWNGLHKPLVNLLSDNCAEVRRMAIWAIHRILEEPIFVGELIEAGAIQFIHKFLSDNDRDMRLAAVKFIYRVAFNFMHYEHIISAGLLPILNNLLSDPDSEVRNEVARVLKILEYRIR